MPEGFKSTEVGGDVRVTRQRSEGLNFRLRLRLNFRLIFRCDLSIELEVRNRVKAFKLLLERRDVDVVEQPIDISMDELLQSAVCLE